MEAIAAGSWAYFQRIWRLRWFWYSLVENDLQTRYRHSFLGIGWSLVRPIGLTTIFCVVFGGLFRVPIDVYAPYVLVSLTQWQFIVENSTQGCRTFHAGAAYIRQQSVPLAIFPLRMTLAAAFHTTITLSLGVVVTWYFHGFANLPALPLVLPSLVLLFILGWSLATICGLLQTHFPDTCYILELFLQFTFYLTPIIYRPVSLQDNANWAWVVYCNPIWSLMELIRQPVLHGNVPPLFNVVVSLVFVSTMAVLALVGLRKLERTLVFWI